MRALGGSTSIPDPAQLWRPFRTWTWVVLVAMGLAAIADLLLDYWFMESLGQARVFETNIVAQGVLFLLGATAFAAATVFPLRMYAVSPELRRAAVHLGLWLGVFAGWMLARRYQVYLLALGGEAFAETDPVFGHDIGFYVFSLPAVEVSLVALLACAATGCLAAVVGRADQLRHAGVLGRPARWSSFGALVTSGFNVSAFGIGASLVALTFLRRYGLLFAENEASGVRLGAEHVDLEGVFSTLNLIHVSVLVEAGLVLSVGYALYVISRRSAVAVGLSTAASGGGARSGLGRITRLAVGLLSLELLFFVSVVLRDHLTVIPNEPTIQVPYIQRHLDATLRGYRLESVRAVPWVVPGEPIPVDTLLASRTVRNAPLLPSWVSYLEEPPDVQHLARLQTTESTLVYGPMLQIYEQEQQLRPYYQFLSVDGVRYTVDGERRMYVSAVRELPSRAFVGAQEWLRYWGSGALMYTHGLGLVVSPANLLSPEGGPLYSVGEVPPVSSDPVLEVEPRVYFGEGAKDDYILTNVRGLKEFDHATRQSRSEFVYPSEAADGIPVDSWLKRLVLAVHTGDVTAFLFSRFIDPERTRVHVHRTPMGRVGRLAPFLFLDSNVYAFAADGRILWMVNGLTTTANYPYSLREVLGDKADERAVEPFPERVINYAEDAVKVTVDAFTGEVHLYRITDDPIVRSWARIYPTLFEDRSAMSAAVEAQLTYPLQWYHIQFDDVYKRYHQRHPIEFYNVEDLWDDADEVVGSIGRGLIEFGTTDQATFSYEPHNVLLDPADLPAGSGIAPEDGAQFALVMPFTPEGARNLRSLVVALQDPGRYGQLLDFRIPQGAFVPGPEQADAYIDEDSQVNQQITLWVRHGSEVMRGHTLLLPVRGDILYVEPLWVASLQNQLPQIKLVSVVYRGRTAMATSLTEALRLLGVSEQDEQRANELPWFREDARGLPAAVQGAEQ